MLSQNGIKMAFKYNHNLPDNNDALRSDIFDGKVYIAPANTASRMLVTKILHQISETFDGDLQTIHDTKRGADFMPGYQTLKKDIARKTFAKAEIKSLLKSLNFDTKYITRDPLRLRIALHEGHLIPAARSAYFIHRDTWYANPQSQINIWMPLFDVKATQGFKFYPSYFDKPVKNSSSGFDYNDWVENTGFGSGRKSTPHAAYPTALQSIPERSAKGFECKAGDLVIFSASHLHGNCTNLSGLTRYSVDFRIVHQNDLDQNKGAPNVDNLSTGNAQKDYHSI